MRKRCCLIMTAVIALAFVTTTFASDFVLEFYLQTESSFTQIHSLHCMLIDSKENNVLDEHFDGDDQVVASLEAGEYTLIVEEPKSHYFGYTQIAISPQSSSSMVFLLNKLGLSYLEGVHSCKNHLACLKSGKCVCDDECVCKRFHQEVELQSVGQITSSVRKSVDKSYANEFSGTSSKRVIGDRCVTGQPCNSFGGCSNLCGGFVDGGYGVASGSAWGGAWGFLGLLGLIGANQRPKPISEEPVYK